MPRLERRSPATRGIRPSAPDLQQDVRHAPPRADGATRDRRGRIRRVDSSVVWRNRRPRGAHLLRGIGYGILFSMPLWAIVALLAWLL